MHSVEIQIHGDVKGKVVLDDNTLWARHGYKYKYNKETGQPLDKINDLLLCAKSHMLSASRWQPHLLHVSAVDRRQTWSMDRSWRCVTLSGFLHSHIVHCRWNPISCGTHYSGPGLSENDSAVTTNVCEDQNREVGLWGLPLKWNWPP